MIGCRRAAKTPCLEVKSSGYSLAAQILALGFMKVGPH